jgi:hypothetical protein
MKVLLIGQGRAELPRAPMAQFSAIHLASGIGASHFRWSHSVIGAGREVEQREARTKQFDYTVSTYVGEARQYDPSGIE